MLADTTQEKPRRPIRSYVLRQGRLSPAQRRACDDFFPLYGVPFSTEAVDWEGIFGRRAPVVLEIGFGMGETTAIIAEVDAEQAILRNAVAANSVAIAGIDCERDTVARVEGNGVATAGDVEANRVVDCQLKRGQCMAINYDSTPAITEGRGAVGRRADAISRDDVAESIKAVDMNTVGTIG